MTQPSAIESDRDRYFMTLVLELASRGRGMVDPNPMVGALVVKGSRIIGRGFHSHYGGLHGEQAALSHCSEDPEGATLYCNLEPCCYRSPEKHQPPCTEAIIDAGISRVVIANRDPNPRVNGAGIAALQGAAIAVSSSLLEMEGRELNHRYFEKILGQKP